MAKIKMFSNTSYENLERDVNAFISDKDVIDIKYQSMFLPTKMKEGNIVSGTITDRVMIIYEERTEFNFKIGDLMDPMPKEKKKRKDE